MKIVKNRPFKRQVTVRLPDEDGTGFVETNFTAHFKALTATEAAEMRLGSQAETEAFLWKVFTGFTGVTEDRDGEDRPLEQTPESMKMLIEDPFVAGPLVKTYLSTFAEAARKN